MMIAGYNTRSYKHNALSWERVFVEVCFGSSRSKTKINFPIIVLFISSNYLLFLWFSRHIGTFLPLETEEQIRFSLFFSLESVAMCAVAQIDVQRNSLARSVLLFACRVILHAFMSSVDFFFFKLTLKKKIYQEYHKSLKRFGPRSGPTFCWA